MFSQKILNALSVYNCKHILLPFSVTSVRRYQHLKCYSKFLPSVNFGTSSIHLGDKCIQEDAEAEEEPLGPPVKITVVSKRENVVMEVNAQVGMTVMSAVLKANPDLVPNACDGQLCCKCCHCFVEENDMKYFAQAGESEEDLLDAFANVKPNSRLACQMKILEKFENVKIEIVPEIKDGS